jgi:magnesium chelatase family protein
MFAQVSTVAFEGIDAKQVDVQVLIAPGLPAFSIVGLPDKSVGESRERVRAALTAIGLGLPAKRITVNLAPADMPKEGTHYDLPIALGVMAAAGAISPEALKNFIIIGELGLDGGLGPIAGALPAALGASSLEKGLICPSACGPEAAWASASMPIIAPAHLVALANHLKGTALISQAQPHLDQSAEAVPDLKDVRGQESAKRALEVAAAGGHHMIMIGAPGTGKSMLAQRLPSILPPLEPQELLEVAMIQSVAGVIINGSLTSNRPFRAPHHSASMAALVGGGTRPKPGEVALAHQWRPLSRRVCGISSACARCTSPANRERRDSYCPGQSPHTVSFALPTRGCDESMSLRPCLDAGHDLQTRAKMRGKLPGKNFGTALGSP